MGWAWNPQRPSHRRNVSILIRSCSFLTTFTLDVLNKIIDHMGLLQKPAGFFVLAFFLYGSRDQVSTFKPRTGLDEWYDPLTGFVLQLGH